MTTLKEAAENYGVLKPEDFSKEIEELKEKIVLSPENPLNYYYLAKEYMLKVPIRAMDSIWDVEYLLKMSIKFGPELWAPKTFLGELLFKVARYGEAEKYLREALEMKPESVSIKQYLVQSIEANSKKIGLKEIELSEKDLLYLFENDLRKFIKKVLENEFKEEWWRKGIPGKIRADCMARRELGLEEEKDLDPILFANFFDYKAVFIQNKDLFGQLLNVKEWCSELNEIEPLRNIIAHNRDLVKAFEKIDKCYKKLKKILKKEGST